MSALRNYIRDWNNKHPFDYFWRRKYGIAFGSEEHLNSNFIDQKIDWEEEKLLKLYQQHSEKRKRLEQYKEDGEWLLPSEERLSDKEQDDLFDSIDLTGYRPTTDESDREEN